MKLIALVKTSRQISEDSWDVFTPTLSIDERTSIGEIVSWAKKHNPTYLANFQIMECEDVETKITIKYNYNMHPDQENYDKSLLDTIEKYPNFFENN